MEIKKQNDAVIGVLVGMTVAAALPVIRSAFLFPTTPL